MLVCLYNIVFSELLLCLLERVFKFKALVENEKGDRGYFSPLNYSKRNDYVDTQENVSSEQFIISGYHKNEKK